MTHPTGHRLSFNPSPRWWLATGAVGLAAPVATWFLWHHTPGTSAWLPPCLFHSMTGLYCTGCGITRAAHALVHGDLATAWSMNALAVLALPVAVLLWAHWGLGRTPAIQGPMRWLRDARVWAMAVLAFTLMRNLPWAPFSALAPG